MFDAIANLTNVKCFENKDIYCTSAIYNLTTITIENDYFSIRRLKK